MCSLRAILLVARPLPSFITSNCTTSSPKFICRALAVKVGRPKKDKAVKQAKYVAPKNIQYSSEFVPEFPNMQRVLHVAEKNDAAKGISAILSRGQNLNRRESRSKYNKIYQFQSAINQFGQQPQIQVFTSVSGHVMNYEFAGAVANNWANNPPRALFDAVINRTVTNPEIAGSLADEARKAQYLVVWTDCDREGENIGDEIVQLCTRANAHLQVWRARFSEITAASVHRAVNNLERGLNQNLVDAVDCRSQLDLRTGAAFTRLITLHLRRTQGQYLQDQGVISYGSCQFPTLGFIVERYKAREAFVSEDFWKLVLTHTKDGLTTTFNWDRVRTFDRAVADLLLDMSEGRWFINSSSHISISDTEFLSANENAVVKSLEQKVKRKWRPVALETVALEKAASRKLRMNAKRAMTAAEKLYARGFISYPRTETNQFPPSINLINLLAPHAAAPSPWQQFAAAIQQPDPRNGQSSDQAHPPIHPLKFSPLDTFGNQDERVVYEFVVRHFLACISRDAQGYETSISVQLEEEGEVFNATGLQIFDRGYLDVYPYENWSDKSLPAYQMNEVFTPDTIEVVEGHTEPPQLLTEADLIGLMEKHGIGTDATHAEHIEKIQQRNYAGLRDDNRFLPGYLGLSLVDGFEAIGHTMSKPDLRAETERGLTAIARGERRKADVLTEQVAKYIQMYEAVERDIATGRSKIDIELEKYWPRGGAVAQQAANNNAAGPAAANNQQPGQPDVAMADENIQPNAVPNTSGLFACHTCAGASFMSVKKGRTPGSFFFGCKSYPTCSATSVVPMSDCISNITELDVVCDRCDGRHRHIEIKFKRGKKPAQFNRATYRGCCQCDAVLREWLNVTRPPANNAAPRCACREPPARRQVKKAGPNQGRWFYACAKPQDGGSCGFFKWADTA